MLTRRAIVIGAGFLATTGVARARGGGGGAFDPFYLEANIAANGSFPVTNFNLAGKTPVNPRSLAGRIGVFICEGQSNICNMVNAAYTPTNPTQILNLSIGNGGLYRASDPLLGCEATGGNWLTRFADKLIAANVYDYVVLVPNGIGGTTITQWSGELASPQTNLSPRFGVAVRRILAVGLTPTAVIYMQGETDNVVGTTQAAYAASGALLITSMRSILPTTPILVGKCTLITNTTVSAGIQAAQAGLVNAPGNVFAGANTDTLTTATNRQADGTHFNVTGADAAATLWVTAMRTALGI